MPEELETLVEVSYNQLPGFPRARVRGHPGRLLFAKMAGAPVLVLCGRAHFYEGHSMDAVTFPVRVLAEFGIQTILLTNAAGGINPRFRTGDFMLLVDHINLMGVNPLRGTGAEEGTRFVDLTEPYDRGLQRLLRRAAAAAGVQLRSGVYLAVSGPSYETPAEIRAFARIGADAVGMSTVPEVIVARQRGMAVAAISCITNPAAGRGKHKLAHAEVLAAAERVKAQAAGLLMNFARLYGAREASKIRSKSKQ